MNYYFKISPKQLLPYFEERIRKWCENCKRFNKSGSCPPVIESIDYYKNLIQNYNTGLLIAKKFEINDINQWKLLGKESSEQLRELFLIVEYYLNLKNVLKFGAGSCKFCPICTIPCSNLNNQLISLEGIGINVIKLIYDISDNEIKLKFPVEKYGYFYRVGLLLWNEQ